MIFVCLKCHFCQWLIYWNQRCLPATSTEIIYHTYVQNWWSGKLFTKRNKSHPGDSVSPEEESGCSSWRLPGDLGGITCMGGALIREGAFIRINIVYAPVLCNHAPYGARESRDIAGLKCHGTAGGLFICVFMAREDYFTHFERSQSQGWAKTGDPQKKKQQNLTTANRAWLVWHVIRDTMSSDLEC